MRSRWLLFTTDFRPMRGGIARLLGSIFDLSPDDVEWRCVTLAQGSPEDGVFRYASLGALCRSVPGHVRWLRTATERQVLCGHPYLQPPALAARLASGARLATMVYGTEIIPKRVNHRVALSLLRLSDVVIADSHYAADVTAEELGVSRRRLRVVLPEFRSPYMKATPPAARIPGQKLRLVTVSRLADVHKNLEVAIRAVSVLAGSGLIDRYTIIGGGPQRASLEELARTLRVDHLVEFLGALDDEAAGAELSSCHVGLFPSRRVDNYFEGFGMVVHELGGAGLPMFVGDSGGTPDACVGEWSILLDPDDVGAWVAQVERLADDEKLRLRLAKEAHHWASGIDSAATVGAYLAAIREDVLTSPR